MATEVLSDLEWKEDCQKCLDVGWYMFEGLKRGCDCKLRNK